MEKLKLLSRHDYVGIEEYDPIRFYFWPLIGRMFRRRVELCLDECLPGERVLEIGFGSGVTFLNLRDKFQEIHGLDLTSKVAEVADQFDAIGITTYLRTGDVLDMPYQDDRFDTVILVSILEHIKPDQQEKAFSEIRRVLKPGGQVVYGVPIESAFMVLAYRLLGYKIREHHFSTKEDVSKAADRLLDQARLVQMKSSIPFLGPVYEVGHFVKR